MRRLLRHALELASVLAIGAALSLASCAYDHGDHAPARLDAPALGR